MRSSVRNPTLHIQIPEFYLMRDKKASEIEIITYVSPKIQFSKTTKDTMPKLFPHDDRDHDINIVQYLSFRVLLNQHWHEAVLFPCETALYQLIQVTFPGHSTILITSSEVRYGR